MINLEKSIKRVKKEDTHHRKMIEILRCELKKANSGNIKYDFFQRLRWLFNL